MEIFYAFSNYESRKRRNNVSPFIKMLLTKRAALLAHNEVLNRLLFKLPSIFLLV